MNSDPTLSRPQHSDYPVRPVDFTAVRITGGFWETKQRVNRWVTVPFALKQCEETGRMQNFDLAAETLRRRKAGETNFQNKPASIYPFDDSDVYKVIEGASYALHVAPDAELEKTLDGWIARVAAAQEPDGYLYTFRTMHPDTPVHEWIHPQRWRLDPELSHEIYNLGHLYEAGVAHFQATGKRSLLDVCLKSAELLWQDFHDGTLRIAPGHQVIEMGLAKLYRITADERWIQLARIFLEARGPDGKEYSQQHARVTDQAEAVGHAVRANYMYAGMADVAALTADTRYANAITRIWNNVAARKLYLTGSVGAIGHGEAYGGDYELPNNGYNETCAAIAFMMWNHRMFLLSGDAKYLDVLERTCFNGFISGASQSGDRFFYPNPLEYDGVSTFNHGFAGRAPWFGCACCPPNLMRTTAAITGYFYATDAKSLFVNFYAESEGLVSVAGVGVRIRQQTDYPWSGSVKLTISPNSGARLTLRLRIPGWARAQPVPSDLYRYDDDDSQSPTLTIDGQSVSISLERGFAVVERDWSATNHSIELNLPMSIHRVVADPRIAAAKDRTALERGPVVYCVEGMDATEAPGELVLDDASETVARTATSGELAGLTLLDVRSAAAARFTAVPYHAWSNRGLSPMAVWLRS